MTPEALRAWARLMSVRTFPFKYAASFPFTWCAYEPGHLDRGVYGNTEEEALLALHDEIAPR